MFSLFYLFSQSDTRPWFGSFATRGEKKEVESCLVVCSKAAERVFTLTSGPTDSNLFTHSGFT